MTSGDCSRVHDLVDAHRSSLHRFCHDAAETLAVDVVALVLASDAEEGSIVAGARADGTEVDDLQFALGQGPIGDAFGSGLPVLEPDLTADPGSRWPQFAPAAIAAGTNAAFAFPLGLGAIRIGVLYLSRHRPGSLSEAELADAFGIARKACSLLLARQASATPGDLGSELVGQWEHRAVAHQATGMISVQIGGTLSDALARLRARAFSEDRLIYDVSCDVVARRVRFEP